MRFQKKWLTTFSIFALNEGSSFRIQTKDKTKPKILNSLQKTFPEVFDPCRRNRKAKHSVMALVETPTEEPVFARTRGLSPEKFRAMPFYQKNPA